MKKLCIVIALILVAISSCYKEKKPAQAFDVLTRHKWKIEEHVNAIVDSGIANCQVPTEVEFEQDSTGYFYYHPPCYAGDNPKKTFRWKVSYDNKNIYLTDLEGVAGTTGVMSISSYDDGTLRLHSAKYKDHYWDGNFISFGDK